MSAQTAFPEAQLRDYSARLANARDRSYALARQVERATAALATLRELPSADPVVHEYASASLESLCETLVRLCAATDHASINAEALSTLPAYVFIGDKSASDELDTAVLSLIDATRAAEDELAGLGEIVVNVCGAIDEMTQDALPY